MKLILVHGINNEENTEQTIRDTWVDTIRMTAGKNAAWADNVMSRTIVPYYGKILDDLADGRSNAVEAMGSANIPTDFRGLLDRAIIEIQQGKPPSEIAVEWEDENSEVAVAQGAGIHKRWLKVAARMIETLSPFRGRIALRVLKQAHAYIENEHIAKEIDDFVRPQLANAGPSVIVSHSLGTIVSYKALRDLQRAGTPVESPLFITLGSPLTIDAVRDNFKRPRNRPANVAKWVNGTDPEDFIALHNAITKDNFGPAVDINISDIDNGHEDPHSISDYLSDKRISEEIASHF